MPSKSKFWNKVAEKYAKSPIEDQESYEIKLDITRDYLTSDSEVLEVGCGTGSTAILHAPYVKHIHGVDISEKMIDIARAKIEPGTHDNVTFEVADLDTYPHSGKLYDVALAMSILHLVEDRLAILDMIYDRLKPGGILVSSTVCLKAYSPLIRMALPVGNALGFLPTVKSFDSARLQKDMTDAGFKIVHQWQPGPKKAVFLICQKPG
jgi:ubiquinone/menaquinone biosynthesis C-methylase UbiE